MSILDQVITLQEAAEKWGLDVSTFRKGILRGEFASDEYRKTGKNYIMLVSAAERFVNSRNQNKLKKNKSNS
ncbi:MAG TPA: helix-turn-helix domain-containing protein [Sedimentibacter sp.]|nr:helix-turn-helix domain-containing protein [Sedimentibacter sp.]